MQIIRITNANELCSMYNLALRGFYTYSDNNAT